MCTASTATTIEHGFPVAAVPPFTKPVMTTTPPSTPAASAAAPAPASTLCDACNGIQRNWRRAPGHPELVQGENHPEKRGRAVVSITRYRCDHCGTAWAYENDKTNQKAGWSVRTR